MKKAELSLPSRSVEMWNTKQSEEDAVSNRTRAEIQQAWSEGRGRFQMEVTFQEVGGIGSYGERNFTLKETHTKLEMQDMKEIWKCFGNVQNVKYYLERSPHGSKYWIDFSFCNIWGQAHISRRELICLIPADLYGSEIERDSLEPLIITKF